MEELFRAFVISLMPFLEEEGEEQKTITSGVAFVIGILAVIGAVLLLSD